MSDFEKVVRPYVPRDVFSARSNVIAQPPVPVVEDARLVIVGKQSASWQQQDVQPFQFSANFDEDKSQRRTSQVRIEDPDDPDTYVEVERIDSMTMVDRNSGASFKINPFEGIGPGSN